MRLRAVAALMTLSGILMLGMLLGPALRGGVQGRASLAPTGARQLAGEVSGDQARMASYGVAVADLRRQPAPARPIDKLRRDMQVAKSEFGFRDAVRSEQEVIYQLAADSNLESQVIRLLPAPKAAGIPDAAEAMRSLWRLAGIDDLRLVRVRHTKDFRASEPVEALHSYYRSAAARYGIDWTYLAAINYIESDFGRSNGPSSAGALGPMQFLPSTWQVYGAGDIMGSQDSITAAAHYLTVRGAPQNYQRALFAYNHDEDYVAAVQHFASALRSDPLWLPRLYYWSTYG
jgi:membrane-bound lytic murein transglycosylase B